MNFQIQNRTGSAITLQGTTYAVNAYVPIEKLIGFGGVKYTRNDIDGPNAGRAMNGLMIRDRVATKGKWEVSLTGQIKSTDAQVVLALVQPETFNIKTDLPTGVMTVYNCYTNNIPVQFSMLRPDGTEYYSGVSIPFVEM